MVLCLLNIAFRSNIICMNEYKQQNLLELVGWFVMANNDRQGPDEMSQNVGYHLGLHCLLSCNRYVWFVMQHESINSTCG